MSNSRLERQIDSWLLWYPKAWREANGPALRGAILDQADAAGSDRLTFADRVALATAGMSVREANRSRLVTIVAGVLFVAFAIWYSAVIVWSPGYEGSGALLWFSNPSVISFAVGAAAVASAVAARPGAALVLGAVATLLQFGFAVASETLSWQGPSAVMFLVFLGLLVIATLPFQKRRSFLAAVAGVILLFVLVQLALAAAPLLIAMISAG
jgi:hypothetical protein